MYSRQALCLFLGAVAFFLNPSFGCDSGFDYGETDMKVAFEGRWSLMPVEGTTPFDSVTLSLTQGSVLWRPGTPPSGVTTVQQAQCGDRVFMRPAGACSSGSLMPVEGKVSAGPVDWMGRSITGSFGMGAVKKAGGALSLTVGSAKLNLLLPVGEGGKGTLKIGDQEFLVRAQRIP